MFRQLSALVMLAMATAGAHAQPLTTAFTFQGQLNSGPAAANGTFDFKFILFDAATGGAPIGPALCSDNLAVAGGVVGAQLDFGPQFSGQQRFLEVWVRPDTGLGCSTNAGFTILGPRQNLTATPNAIFSLNAAASTTASNAVTAATATDATQLNGQPAAFYSNAGNLSGTLPSGVLSGTYPGTVTLSNASNAFSGSGAGLTGLDASSIAAGTIANARTTGTFLNTPGTLVLRDPLGGFSAGGITSSGFSGPGPGLTNLNASALATGSVPDARLSTNVARLNTGNAFGNFTNSFQGNVGIGTTNPGFPLHIASTFAALALQDTGGDSTQAGYISYRNTTGTETAWAGFGTAGSPDFSIVNARTNGNIILSPFSGNVGIGTAPASTARLHSVTSSTTGRAVLGEATAFSGANYGVYGSSVSPSGFGVFGVRGGVSGLLSGTPAAIRADTSAGHAMIACTSFQSSDGVLGQASGDHGFAVEGLSTGPSGLGMFAHATSTTAQAGIWAENNTGQGYGVFGRALLFNGSAGTAIFANGTFGASGTKSFRIDHPSDPAHKYLLHYCNESPQPHNTYTGRATLDERGEALVTLPDYFAAINSEPEYTLTALGSPMPLLHIAGEIEAAALNVGAKVEPGQAIPVCTFRIAGGAPGGKVSWRVEASRNDRWVQQRGAPVEVDKVGREDGLYQHPDLYGQPADKGLSPRPASGGNSTE